MKLNGTLTTIGAWPRISDHPNYLTLQSLTKWSVQGSNLRPPVTVGTFTTHETPRSPSHIVGEPRPKPRTTGEIAESKDNDKAIRP